MDETKYWHHRCPAKPYSVAVSIGKKCPHCGQGEPVQAPDPVASITQMTMRQWYAGQALIGIIRTLPTFGEDARRDGANLSFRFADAMIEAEKEPNK